MLVNIIKFDIMIVDSMLVDRMSDDSKIGPRNQLSGTPIDVLIIIAF